MEEATIGPTEDRTKDALLGIRHITAAVNEINASIPNPKLNEVERKQVQDAILKVAHGISQTLHGIDGMAARLSASSTESIANERVEEVREVQVQTEPSLAREPKSSNSLALVALVCVAAIAGLSLIFSVALLSITALGVGVYVVTKSLLK